MLAAISWDPGFRGLLTVVVGTLVLGGSVYLLLATNSGPRLGFLLALTGLASWMMIMGVVWAIYGIGYQGRAATWEIEEVNYGDLSQANTVVARSVPPQEDLPEARALIEGNEALEQQFPDDPTAREPQIGDLLSVDPDLDEDPALEGIADTDDGWELLAAADPQTGEATAAATAYLVDERGVYDSTADLVVLDTWSNGGKDDLVDDANWLDRVLFKAERILTWPLGHPEHTAVVQVQQVIPREEVPGEPPPTPVADPEAPVVSVVMLRDLGSQRLPATATAVASGIVFAVCVVSLNRRDKLVREARAAAAAAGS
ncbi:hypothetical protein PO878_19760 [Iamia majanohamensis]|uniref:Uncharacterized protein n=1 Tax=Iamia majanohamensis TaxID=467976 RepID=A0AAE9YF84_9ACTN|nr:hypothetical protein [Iamia majanohamensis]WCO66731.1 hypothetical protein PO878_19760 [Iamia majanohamensis]